MEASSHKYFAIEDTFFSFFFKLAAMQLICCGPIGPQHIFDHLDVIHAWSQRTLSEMKSQ